MTQPPVTRAEPPLPVAVVCACGDPAGRAFGRAMEEQLRRDSRFRAVSRRDADLENAIQIRIVSQPQFLAGGLPQGRIFVEYSHEGASVQQTIETTCPEAPLNDLAAGMLDRIHDLERASSADLPEETTASRP